MCMRNICVIKFTCCCNMFNTINIINKSFFFIRTRIDNNPFFIISSDCITNIIVIKIIELIHEVDYRQL